MADKSFFGRLRRLFSSNVIVRNIGGKKLKVVDTDERQMYRNAATNFVYDRFNRLHNGFSQNSALGYGQHDLFHTQRLEIFNDYEGMDSDSVISSALDIYSDECTVKNEYGNSLKITSTNEDINKILNNLFYDILNIEFNLWPWTRNLVKYGDLFLKLDIAEGSGVVNVVPMSVYEVSRLEGMDPNNPNYVQFIAEPGDNALALYGKKEFENYEIAHFRLLSDSNLLPYGKSMLEGARKVWKQLTLMEDAMLIHRIMRAPEKRIFKLDIGNIPPNEVDNYMQQVINKMKKAPYVDTATGDYNLKYNMQNITEDFFLPVRGGDSGTSIDTLSGAQWDSLDDINYLRDKMLGSLKIPRAFLGYEENVNAKATLAAEDVRFARTIERLQRILVSELTKIAVVHLYSQGYKDAELVDFQLELTNPSTIYEQEKVELWTNKISLASSMMQDSIMSTEWIYKNIFDLDPDDIKNVRQQIIDDQKRQFRYEQIKMEGNDPVKTEQSFGTPHDLAVLQMKGQENLGQGAPGEGGAPGAPEEGFENAGRPKEGPKYGQDSGARGRDPLGAKDMKKFDKVGKPLSTEQVANLINKMPKVKSKTILKETFKNKSSNNIVESVKKSFEEDEKSFLNEEKLLKDKS